MMAFLNSNRRFHECMPKECHAIYDTLKLMEKQEEKEKDIKKVEVKKDANDVLDTDIKNKNDKLLDISA